MYYYLLLNFTLELQLITTELQLVTTELQLYSIYCNLLLLSAINFPQEF